MEKDIQNEGSLSGKFRTGARGEATCGANWRTIDSLLQHPVGRAGKSSSGMLADELFRKEAKLFRIGLIHEDENKFLHASLFKCRQTLTDSLGAANQT